MFDQRVKLSLATKIFLGFMVLLLCAVVLAFFSVVQIRNVAKDLRAIKEGHLALASVLSNEMRLEDAEAEFRRVITRAPNNPTVHQWYATCLLGMGRVEEALAASRRAVARVASANASLPDPASERA